jgi:hypothetical protein
LIKKQWQVPKYWQDFEEMCWLLYKARFPHHQVHRYGRSGQMQHGVDIAVSPDRREWIGIQCKLKSELRGSSLSESEIVEEHGKSRKYEPALSRLYIVTSCARDKDVQDLAAKISDSFQSKHPVEVFFWDDVEDWLEGHREVANRFYPEVFPPAVSLNETEHGDLNITLQPSDWHERLELLFKHSIFRAAAGGQWSSLMTITSETVDNALNPGKGGASRVMISLSGPLLIIRDDGASFDSVSAEITLTPQMCGIRAIRESLHKAGPELIYRYEPKDPAIARFNRTEIEIRAASLAPRDPCSASGPTHFLLNRTTAREFVRQLSIPAACSTYTLQLLGSEYFTFSARAELIADLLKRLRGRHLHIKVAYNTELLDALRREAASHPEVTIEQID